jgi:hypothetical protein
MTNAGDFRFPFDIGGLAPLKRGIASGSYSCFIGSTPLCPVIFISGKIFLSRKKA